MRLNAAHRQYDAAIAAGLQGRELDLLCEAVRSNIVGGRFDVRSNANDLLVRCYLNERVCVCMCVCV